MLHVMMSRLAEELTAYLDLRAPVTTPGRVFAGSLLDLAGQPNAGAKGHVVLSVVNVDENRVYRSLDQYRKRGDGVSERIKPPVRLDVSLLIVANYADYNEALKMLSFVISFFQQRGSFDMPVADGARAKVQFELLSTTFEQQNHLWAALGAKYMPSVIYKAGILDIRDSQVEAEVPPVEEIRTEP
jgi:Pvc16 N-terminal domain